MSTKARLILIAIAVLLVLWGLSQLASWVVLLLMVLGVATALFLTYRALTRRSDATGWMTRRLSRQIETAARKQMADLERRQKQR